MMWDNEQIGHYSLPRGVNSESNGENWVKYAMIRYKINANITLTYNLHTTAEKDESLVTDVE